MVTESVSADQGTSVAVTSAYDPGEPTYSTLIMFDSMGSDMTAAQFEAEMIQILASFTNVSVYDIEVLPPDP